MAKTPLTPSAVTGDVQRDIRDQLDKLLRENDDEAVKTVLQKIRARRGAQAGARNATVSSSTDTVRSGSTASTDDGIIQSKVQAPVRSEGKPWPSLMEKIMDSCSFGGGCTVHGTCEPETEERGTLIKAFVSERIRQRIEAKVEPEKESFSFKELGDTKSSEVGESDNIGNNVASRLLPKQGPVAKEVAGFSIVTEEPVPAPVTPSESPGGAVYSVAKEAVPVSKVAPESTVGASIVIEESVPEPIESVAMSTGRAASPVTMPQILVPEVSPESSAVTVSIVAKELVPEPITSGTKGGPGSPLVKNPVPSAQTADKVNSVAVSVTKELEPATEAAAKPAGTLVSVPTDSSLAFSAPTTKANNHSRVVAPSLVAVKSLPTTQISAKGTSVEVADAVSDASSLVLAMKDHSKPAGVSTKTPAMASTVQKQPAPAIQRSNTPPVVVSKKASHDKKSPAATALATPPASAKAEGKSPAAITPPKRKGSFMSRFKFGRKPSSSSPKSVTDILAQLQEPIGVFLSNGDGGFEVESMAIAGIKATTAKEEQAVERFVATSQHMNPERPAPAKVTTVTLDNLAQRDERDFEFEYDNVETPMGKMVAQTGTDDCSLINGDTFEIDVGNVEMTYSKVKNQAEADCDRSLIDEHESSADEDYDVSQLVIAPPGVRRKLGTSSVTKQAGEVLVINPALTGFDFACTPTSAHEDASTSEGVEIHASPSPEREFSYVSSSWSTRLAKVVKSTKEDASDEPKSPIGFASISTSPATHHRPGEAVPVVGVCDLRSQAPIAPSPTPQGVKDSLTIFKLAINDPPIPRIPTPAFEVKMGQSNDVILLYEPAHNWVDPQDQEEIIPTCVALPPSPAKVTPKVIAEKKEKPNTQERVRPKKPNSQERVLPTQESVRPKKPNSQERALPKISNTQEYVLPKDPSNSFETCDGSFETSLGTASPPATRSPSAFQGLEDILFTNASIDDIWIAREVFGQLAAANGKSLEDVVEEVCDEMDRVERSISSSSLGQGLSRMMSF